MLFRRFHEDVLRSFGFKRIDGPNVSGNRSSFALNESGVSNKAPPLYQQSMGNNGSFVDESRDRSSERMPPAGHPSTMSQDLRPSQLPNKPLDRKSNLSQNNINKPPIPASPAPNQSSVIQSNTNISSNSQYMNQTDNDPY